MLKQRFKHITEGNTYLGLGITETEGRERFSLLKLRKQKGELEVLSEMGEDTLDALIPFMEKGTPLFVTINTPKVLKKQILTAPQNNPALLVMNAFPNLELDNFYYQVLPGKQHSAVCISKKEYIDGYLEQLSNIGLQPFQVAIGISSLQVFEGLLHGKVMGMGFEVHFDPSGFDGFLPNSAGKSYKINLHGIEFQNSQLLAFAQILGYLQNRTVPSNLQPRNQILHDAFKNARIFALGLKIGLGFFLILLLTNFLVFNHYHAKNQEMEANLNSSQYQNNAVAALQERVDQKEQRLRSLTHSKNTKTSYYLDELGKSIPNSINLDQIQYQPLLVPVRENKAIKLQKENLQISGVVNDKVAFTEWSDMLEKQKWIQKIQIMDYEYRSKTSANFTLNLVLDETEQKK